MKNFILKEENLIGAFDLEKGWKPKDLVEMLYKTTCVLSKNKRNIKRYYMRIVGDYPPELLNLFTDCAKCCKNPKYSQYNSYNYLDDGSLYKVTILKSKHPDFRDFDIHLVYEGYDKVLSFTGNEQGITKVDVFYEEYGFPEYLWFWFKDNFLW